MDKLKKACFCGMKNYVIMAKCLVIFVAVLIITVCSLYRIQIRPVDKNAEDITFEVVDGDTWYSIGQKLYDAKLIHSTKFYKIYIKLFTPKNLEVGVYSLSGKMNLPTLIETLENDATNPYLISVTFKEGVNMRSIAKTIDENTVNTYDDVMNLLKDTEYIDSLINEYWFLTDEIKNTNIYYPLEGYLFPNTYNIDSRKDVKSIFKVMLDQMDIELSKYKKNIDASGHTVHELLTLASIVELEAGNASDRASVAGVFYNRIKNKWTLGSDVTTYYALQIDDFKYSLSKKELNTCNKYNTRSTCFIGLPVGPIANAGIESINAAINPTETTMYYFVADCSGKTYLDKTYNDHNKTIAKLKKENNWCQ